MKKLWLACVVLIVLFVAFLPAQGAENTLSLEEITEILYDIAREENAAGDYLVLPEGYSAPALGLDRTFRLLVLGVDTDDAKFRGRSDTMMLAVVDMRKSELKLISFMRDLYVQIPGKGHNRLNAAYAFGGAELLERTLEKNFGVSADGYVAVNFSGMVTLVDSIGGVDITVEESELGSLNGILEYYNYQNERPEAQGRLEKAGHQTLTGLQAMSYARIRKIDSDFERTGRQQRVMNAIFTRIRSMTLPSLLDVVFENAHLVSTDISLDEAVSLVSSTLSMDSVNTRYLRIPVARGGKGTLLNETYFIVPNLKKNKQAIADFLGAGVAPQ